MNYYVKNNGNDSLDGLTDATAWKTIEKVNSFTFTAGDSILFNKGDLWREEINSTFAGSYTDSITIGAYGFGELPKLFGSVNSNDLNTWVHLGSNIWVNNDSLGSDVGNLVFNYGLSWGVKKQAENELTSQGDFWYDFTNDEVKIYSTSNPNTYYIDIEVVLWTFNVNLASSRYVQIENIDFRYSCYAIFGFKRYGITIQSCEFRFIGGCDQLSDYTVRLGNAIEFWEGGNNLNVFGCYFDNVYDAGITLQGGTDTSSSNIHISGNIIKNCEYSYETFHRGDNTVVSNFYFENNTCIDAGGGFGHDQRWDWANGRHIMYSAIMGTVTNWVVRNNIFQGATESAISLRGGTTTGNYKNLTFENNCYYVGVVGAVDGVNKVSLADWQAYDSQDLDSIDADPLLDENYVPLASSPVIATSIGAFEYVEPEVEEPIIENNNTINTMSDTTQIITYEDKQHVLPYGTRINQWWDLDGNMVKTVVNFNASITDGNTQAIIGLEASQKTGFIAKETLAEIQALIPDTETAYYVLNDPDPANNGMWGYNGAWYQASQTVNSGEFDPANNVTPATQKSTADYLPRNYAPYNRVSIGISTTTEDTYAYVFASLTAPKRLIYQGRVLPDPEDLFTFDNNFLNSDKLEVVFSDIVRDNIIFISEDNMIMGEVFLTTEQKTAGVAILDVPDGTVQVMFATERQLIPTTTVTVLRQGETLNPDDYEYLAYSNLLDRDSVTTNLYLDEDGNEVAGGNSNYTSDYFKVQEGFLNTNGVNIRVGSGIFFYDVDYNLIGRVLRTELTWNPVEGEPTYWDMLLEVSIPVEAYYCRYSADTAYFSGLNDLYTYACALEYANVFQKVNIEIYENGENGTTNKIIENNIQTQKNVAGDFLLNGSDIASKNKTIIVENKAETGVGRIAFRFKFLEDVNTENSEKKLVEIISSDGTGYFNFVVNNALTTPLIGEDYPPEPTLTTYPVPRYNSGFGWRTNLEGVDETRRNIDYESRGFGTPEEDLNYKPLVGENLFYLRLKTGEILSSQALCTLWSDLTLETTATQISLTSVKNSLSIVTTYSNFDTLRMMYFDFKSKIDASILANDIEVTSVALGGRLPSEVLQPRYEDFNLWGNPSDITIMSVPLVSEYYIKAEEQALLDSYPAYVTKGIDDSWHTFEFISCQNKDTAVFTIDGQWIVVEGDYAIQGIREAFNEGGQIIIGGESQIDIKDLTIEFDQYTDVELRDEAPTSSLFLSTMHPHIAHFYGHDLYYCEDQNIPLSEDSAKYHSYVSEGGFIPDELKNPDPDYRGDDSIQEHRKGLAYPSWKLEMFLRWATEAGYTCITNEELGNFQRMGTPLPSKKCYLIGFDDIPTYIWDKLELRRIFRKYSAKPYFAIELGFYVNDSMTSDTYIIPTFIANSKDTNEHRLALKERLRTMQLEGWGVVLHGAKEGFYHRGVSYNDMIVNLNDAVQLASQLNVDSQWWCLAANGSTVNQIKLHDTIGIVTSSSTKETYCSLCHHPNYTPRDGWEVRSSSPDYYLKSKFFSY